MALKFNGVSLGTFLPVTSEYRFYTLSFVIVFKVFNSYFELLRILPEGLEKLIGGLSVVVPVLYDLD